MTSIRDTCACCPGSGPPQIRFIAGQYYQIRSRSVDNPRVPTPQLLRLDRPVSSPSSHVVRRTPACMRLFPGLHTSALAGMPGSRQDWNTQTPISCCTTESPLAPILHHPPFRKQSFSLEIRWATLLLLKLFPRLPEARQCTLRPEPKCA